MAAARDERPVSLRVILRPSRLALALSILATALAAIAIARSSLADSPLVLVLWAFLALTAGALLRGDRRHAGEWLLDRSPEGIARLREASGHLDDAPTFLLRRRTCWPFLLVIGAVDAANRRSLWLVAMIDALPHEDFRRLAVWLRRARCAQEPGQK